jgi:hypothetical protein
MRDARTHCRTSARLNRKLMTMHGHHTYLLSSHLVHVHHLRHHVERLSCRDSWRRHYGTVSCFPPSVQTAQRADHPHREERPFRRVDTQRSCRGARCRREPGQRAARGRPTNHPVQLQAHPRAGTCFSPAAPHHPVNYIFLQIHLLDLRSEVLSTPRASPAGRNRFLHVPPSQGLQALPSSILTALTLPLGRLVLRSVLSEPFARANTPTDDDESVDAFFTRRFGAAFARTLGSALVHGIYAADSRKLSVGAAFPMLRASERRGNGSVIWGELGPAAWFGRAGTAGEEERWVTGERVDPVWDARVAAAAVLSFRGGMETLVRALVDALRGFRNVTLRSGTAVRTIIERASDGAPFSRCVRVSAFALTYSLYARRFTSRTSRSRSKLHISSLRSRCPFYTPSSPPQNYAPAPPRKPPFYSHSPQPRIRSAARTACFTPTRLWIPRPASRGRLP